jgi:hypothetical protein
LNVRTGVLGLLVALTIVLASTTIYESGARTTVTSTSTTTSVSTVTSTTTQTTTFTSTVDLTKTLTDAYASHIGAIESRNATGLAAQYETNATLQYSVWNGSAELSGSVGGTANITRFYGGEPTNMSQAVSCPTCIDLKAPFAVANETYSIMMSSDDKAGSIMSHLVFYGNDSVDGGCYVIGVGACNMDVYVMSFDISYVLHGGGWLISTESLTYINSSACMALSLSSDGSIVTCQFSSA